MIDCRTPWKWPLAIAAAVLSLAVLPLLPRAWLSFLLPDVARLSEVAVAPDNWLWILPPPRPVELALQTPAPTTRRDPPPPVERTDAQWWQLALRARIVDDRVPAGPTAPVDSVRVLLRALGLAEDFAVRARPDSTLAARLLLMERSAGYLPESIRPFLLAMGRAEAYRDLVSRATAMYDEFLQHEIITPD